MTFIVIAFCEKRYYMVILKGIEVCRETCKMNVCSSFTTNRHVFCTGKKECTRFFLNRGEHEVYERVREKVILSRRIFFLTFLKNVRVTKVHTILLTLSPLKNRKLFVSVNIA